MKKLLLITFRQSLEEDLKQLLHDIGVTNYTEITGVTGVGESGKATGAYGWGPGINSMLLVVLDEEQATPVLEKLKAFHQHLAQQQPSMKIPIRLFVLPCDQII